MRYDAIIIGTGQAGPALARTLTAADMNVAVVEKGDYGGSCVNVGCTPTKAYVASARRAWVAGNSSDHGVEVNGGIRVNLKKIKSRKDKLVESSRKGLKKTLENTENITVYRGHARFTGSHEVSVDGEQLEAGKIFINTGARPRIPDGFEGSAYLTNRTILDLEEVPEHLVIVGAGYVGLEFAQIFRRFGSAVTIVEQGDRVLKSEESDLSNAIVDIFRREGIEFRFDAECIGAESRNGNVSLSLDCREGEPTLAASHVLVAAGRIPNTDDLGLDRAGIRTDDRGYIRVNKHLETSVEGVFALGDCNGEGAFTHTAYNDFQIVKSFLTGDGSRTLYDRIPCYAVYIDPAVARAGMNEEEALKKANRVKIAYREMSRVSRAKEMGETDGFLKIIIDADTDRILGASFLGPGADEYIHSLIDLMYAGAPYTVIRDAVHIHPTISELIPTMLGKLRTPENS